jgi:hypothetical protein
LFFLLGFTLRANQKVGNRVGKIDFSTKKGVKDINLTP